MRHLIAVPKIDKNPDVRWALSCSTKAINNGSEQ
ncbi:hypothetical protein V1277_006840 [Bradyrhizobium sp. AZCC 1588]